MKRYLSQRRRAMAQANLRIRTVLPESSLFAHTKYGTRGSFRKRDSSLALLGSYACSCEGSLTAQHNAPFCHETAHLTKILLQRKTEAINVSRVFYSSTPPRLSFKVTLAFHDCVIGQSKGLPVDRNRPYSVRLNLYRCQLLKKL